MMRRAILTLSLALLCLAAGAQSVFVETESFADKGGWSLDQQFTDLMGSPYLIAHGYGKPVLLHLSTALSFYRFCHVQDFFMESATTARR